MKKISLIILAALLCCAVMPSCAQQNETSFDPSHLLAGDFTNVTSADRSDDISDQSSVESSEDMSDNSSSYTESSPAESSEPEKWGSAETYERNFPDELYQIGILGEIVPWEDVMAIEEWIYKNEYFQNDQLPSIYLNISKLNISKEDFIQVNEERKENNRVNGSEQTVYSDEQIKILFSGADIPTIQQALKNSTTYIYNGELYSIPKVVAMSSSKLNKMAKDNSFNEFLDELLLMNDGYLISCVDEIKSKISN